MEDTDSQIYRLHLSTWTGFPGLLDNSNKASVSWNVDYDSLFNRENYNYKNCRLRYKLVSDANTNISHVANNGVLAISGLGSINSSKNISIGVLDPIVPTIGSTHGWFNLSTMDEVGIDISMPYGLSVINPQFWDSGFGANGNAVLQTMTSQYSLVLSFELYNHK